MPEFWPWLYHCDIKLPAFITLSFAGLTCKITYFFLNQSTYLTIYGYLSICLSVCPTVSLSIWCHSPFLSLPRPICLPTSHHLTLTPPLYYLFSQHWMFTTENRWVGSYFGVDAFLPSVRVGGKWVVVVVVVCRDCLPNHCSLSLSVMTWTYTTWPSCLWSEDIKSIITFLER